MNKTKTILMASLIISAMAIVMTVPTTFAAVPNNNSGVTVTEFSEAAVITTSGATGNIPPQIDTFKIKDEFASAFIFGFNGDVFVDVRPTDDPKKIFLFYNIFDFNTFQFNSGIGLVPSSTFTGSATNKLSLNVDTSTLDPNEFDVYPPNSHIIISLDWKKRDFGYTESFSGHSERCFPTGPNTLVCFRDNISSKFNQAQVSGTIGGILVDDSGNTFGFADMSKQNGVRQVVSTTIP